MDTTSRSGAFGGPERQEDREITSPGPLHMSDLNLSPPPLNVHPRRLEPINPVKRKRKRTKKRDPDLRTPAPEDEPKSGTPISLIGDSLRNQLRSRLDPIYNSTPPSRMHDSVEGVELGEGVHLTPPSQTRDGVEGVELGLNEGVNFTTADSSHKEEEEDTRRRDTERRKKRTRRKIKREMETSVVSQSAVPEGEDGGSANHEERQREMPVQDQDMETRGRQLPDLPPDMEGMLNTSFPTVADQLASGQGLGDRQTTRENLQSYLSDEDVIDEGVEDHMTQTFALTHPHIHTHTSHNKDVIFVERKDGRGFVVQKKGQENSSKGDEWAGIPWAEREVTTAQVTQFVHRGVQRISITAHGLLAGISLWDCIVSNVVAVQSDRHVGVLTVYNPLTLPLHAVYLLLISIVTVSLFDRLDFAGVDRHCLKHILRPPTQLFVLLALFLVFLALTLTVSVAAIDERISLYPLQPSLWPDILDPYNATSSVPSPTTHTVGGLVYAPGASLVSSMITTWLALSIVRAVCCCLSWITAIWISNTDRLEDYLQTMSVQEERKAI